METQHRSPAPFAAALPPLVGALLCAGLAAPEARAGAFQIREGSAAAQGASFAGRTSGDRDVSFALHNPAALRTVERFEASAGFSAILATGEPDVTIGGVTTTEDTDDVALVPSTIAGYRVNEHVVLGLAVDAPFGLATEYGSSWAASAYGVESELTNITVTPLVSIQPVPDFSIGVGATLSYAEARLTNRTIGGVSSLEGDDFGVGFTVGALVDLGPRTTVGASFQSQVDHKLDGDLSSNYIVPTPGGPLNVGGPGSADLNLPPVASLGITHGFTDDFRVMAEFEYVGWSTFQSIDAFSANTGVTLSETQDYDDSIFLAAGAEYDVTDAFTIRGGVAYDQTPTVDAHRTVRTPDADRIWLSAGASYEISDSVGIDAAYSFLIFDDTQVTLTDPGRGVGTVDYDGNTAHIFSVNARFKW